MARVIVTGPTGNAGSAILTQTLASPHISHVTTLSRKPPYTDTSNPKLTSLIIPSGKYPNGFGEFPTSLVEEMKGSSAIIWALGISQTQVSKEEYLTITHDYTLIAAKALQTLGTKEKPFKFIYVSGEGADQSESGRALFSKIKGRTEKALSEMASETFETVSVRPGGIIPTAELLIPRHAPRMPALMRYGLVGGGWLFERIMPSMVINASDLGAACVGLATGRFGWDRRTSEGWIANGKLREIAELYKKDMSPL